MDGKRKRKQLTLDTKYEIIRAAETESNSKIAARFELAASTVTGILKMKNNILESYQCRNVRRQPRILLT